MYCKHCGNLVADNAKFCSFCGTPAMEPTQEKGLPQQGVQPEVQSYAEPAADVNRKPIFEEFQWNVNDYPDTGYIGKTEDVDFNWNSGSGGNAETGGNVGFGGSVTSPGPDTGQINSAAEADQMSAADRIDKFYTFNKKNEEFQNLLNREYQKVKDGNAIAAEISEANELASVRFENRAEPTTMDDLFEREGVIKPYEPKPFHTDVLDRIDAQEAAREMKRREEEAREKALEEARREAEAKRKAEAEEARIRAEAEARVRAEEAARENERLKEEARIRAEEAARFRAEEEARIRAEEEARLRAEAEARRRAEAEAVARAEEEARIAAEEKARIRAEIEAEKEAKLRAQAEARAVQEAEKIKSQQEARMVAKEEDRARLEVERRRAEESRLRSMLKDKRENISKRADSAVVEQEAQKVLEQTAKMREAEAAKIRAAIAGIKGEAIASVERVAQDAVPEISMSESRGTGFQSNGGLAPRDGRIIEQAHQTTKDRISNMARAREDYFAALEDNRPQRPVTGRDTMLGGDEDLSKTRVIDKSAILAGVEATKKISKADMRDRSDREFFAGLDNTGLEPAPDFVPNALKRKDELGTAEELLGQFVIANNVQKPEAAGLVQKAEPVSGMAPAAIDPEKALNTGIVLPDERPRQEQTPGINQGMSPEGFAAKEEPLLQPNAGASLEVKPGLADTMVMAGNDLQEAFANGFDNYGEEEAAKFRAAQEAQGTSENLPQQNPVPVADGTDVKKDKASAKAKAKEARAQAKIDKAKAKEAKTKAKEVSSESGQKKKGGAGRIVMKIILIILIVCFAVELVGMGILQFAKGSAAAEYIDNQVNKVIHLIGNQ